jgi:hypothetical protein
MGNRYKSQHLILSELFNVSLQSEDIIDAYGVNLPVLNADTLVLWDRAIAALDRAGVSHKRDSSFTQVCRNIVADYRSLLSSMRSEAYG